MAGKEIYVNLTFWEVLDSMTNDQRHEFMKEYARRYCVGCGMKFTPEDDSCQCWNDE